MPDLRALNRALLARQLLLERARMPAADAVEHLIAIQAQEAQAPYVALWSRVEDFDPQELSELIAERQAVRTWVNRSTIHLVAARDALVLSPLTRPVLERAFKGTAFSKQLGGAPLDEVLAAGRELMEREPRTRGELGRLLGVRWPDADPDALGSAIGFLSPNAQVPPRGLWRQAGPARLTTLQSWLGTELDPDPDPAPVIERYLAAYGPATVKDVQAWCGLTRLRAVTDRMDHLVRLEDGLLDVPGAPMPDPGTPAPPRFLAPFDNAILSHADRGRIIAPEHRKRIQTERMMRTFLVDGFVAGAWRLDGDAIRTDPFVKLTRAQGRELEDEAERLRDFLVA